MSRSCWCIKLSLSLTAIAVHQLERVEKTSVKQICHGQKQGTGNKEQRTNNENQGIENKEQGIRTGNGERERYAREWEWALYCKPP